MRNRMNVFTKNEQEEMLASYFAGYKRGDKSKNWIIAEVVTDIVARRMNFNFGSDNGDVQDAVGDFKLDVWQKFNAGKLDEFKDVRALLNWAHGAADNLKFATYKRKDEELHGGAAYFFMDTGERYQYKTPIKQKIDKRTYYFSRQEPERELILSREGGRVALDNTSAAVSDAEADASYDDDFEVIDKISAKYYGIQSKKSGVWQASLPVDIPQVMPSDTEKNMSYNTARAIRLLQDKYTFEEALEKINRSALDYCLDEQLHGADTRCELCKEWTMGAMMKSLHRVKASAKKERGEAA